MAMEVLYYIMAILRLIKIPTIRSNSDARRNIDYISLVDTLNPYLVARFSNRNAMISEERMIIAKERYLEDNADLLQKKLEEQEKKESLQSNHQIVKRGCTGFWSMLREIEAEGDENKEKYCRYCYFGMNTHKGGHVTDYFRYLEEEGGYSLDDEDTLHIKRLFRYRCQMCPLCYRPYRISKNISSDDSDSDEDDLFDQFDQLLGIEAEEYTVDRYSRHKVLSEIASFYIFLLFVWIPLVILLCIPALLSYIAQVVEKMNDITNNNDMDNFENNSSFSDFHRGYWKNAAQRAIGEVKEDRENAKELED